ncbi:MAG: YceI family protein, partial [Desulfurivibrionaceae bacterium]
GGEGKAALDSKRAAEDPWGNQRKGGKITATIDRTDFGITYNNTLPNGGVTIGNTVEIVTDFEIVIPETAPPKLGNRLNQD